MPECDTRVRSNVADSSLAINRRVNSSIRAARATGASVQGVINYVYNDLGKSITPWYAFTDPNYNKSGIELFVDSLPSTQAYPVQQRWTKYNGVHSTFLWGADTPGYTRIISPTMNINGIYIGADKLGHFMQQGYDYYRLLVHPLGGGTQGAEAWSHGTEVGSFGLGSTGIYSNADRVANTQGGRFYSWLATNPTTGFDIRTYVNHRWNEEINTNSYHENLMPVVWNNILSTGNWTGSFTILGDPASNNGIPMRINFNFARGYPEITGRINYTYHSGPVTVDLNGIIAPIPYGSGNLGYRGIRITYAWTSGQNSGRGLWRSGHYEHWLSGSWGWGISNNNGGTYRIHKT